VNLAIILRDYLVDILRWSCQVKAQVDELTCFSEASRQCKLILGHESNYGWHHRRF
jgi:hypothetical protein